VTDLSRPAIFVRLILSLSRFLICVGAPPPRGAACVAIVKDSHYGMDLRQLEILAAIAQTGSFTGAGHRLHVSQSAISRQILLLEEELNEPVFLRIGRRVRITPAGEALLQLGHRIFGDITETRAQITEGQRVLRGTLQLAGGMTVCLYVFPTLLKEYRKRHPEVGIQLVTGATPRLVRKLRTGTADLALLTLPIEGADLVTVPVMEEELLLVMPPNHKLARLKRTTPSDLVGQEVVLFETGSSTRRVIDMFFVTERIQPRVVMETENVEILKSLVRAGMGISILPYQAIAREVASGQLFCARLSTVRLVRQTGWVYLRTSRVSRPVQEMFQTLTRILPRLKLSPTSKGSTKATPAGEPLRVEA
jgi:DNA-binding transcriptional LysR family regulator